MKRTIGEKEHQACAANLVEFGYPGVTEDMIREIDEARRNGESTMPHGIIGMFARKMLQDWEDGNE